jgi:hypothetical protein
MTKSFKCCERKATKKKIFTLEVFEMMPHGTLINKPAAVAKSLAYVSLLQRLDAFFSCCPQTCL